MTNFLSFCWALSYIFAFVSFVVHAWRWSAEVRTWEAMVFWLVLVSLFGIIGLVVVRNVKG